MDDWDRLRICSGSRGSRPDESETPCTKTFQVWDIESGEVLHRFTGHKASVKAVSLSQPEGDLGSVHLSNVISFITIYAGHGFAVSQVQSIFRG